MDRKRRKKWGSYSGLGLWEIETEDKVSGYLCNLGVGVNYDLRKIKVCN